MFVSAQEVQQLIIPITVTDLELSSFLKPYGLAVSDLTDERKRQLGVIFTEAAKSAGGTAIQVGTRILQEEAAKRGIKTGTIGSSENSQASKQVEVEIEKSRLAEQQAQQRKIILISVIGVGVMGVVIAIIVQLRKKPKR